MSGSIPPFSLLHIYAFQEPPRTTETKYEPGNYGSYRCDTDTHLELRTLTSQAEAGGGPTKLK